MISNRGWTGGSGYKIAVFALATLLVVVLAVSYISYFNLESVYFQLRSDYAQIQGKYSQLENEYSSLRNDYSRLSSIHRELESEYTKLLEDYNRLGLEFKTLQNKYSILQDKYDSLESEHAKLESEYQTLSLDYKKLSADYSKLSANHTLLLTKLTVIGINTDNIDELWKLREVMVTRTYLIYDYEEDLWRWYFWHWIPIKWYFYERTRIIHEPMTLEDRVVKYSKALVEEYIHHPLINDVADFLWEASGGDEEKFVNYVLELVHQLPYNETYYAKSPIETFIEGSGDCDNLAILAATIIENKGLDAVLIYGTACSELRCGGHAMIGVALPKPPDDLFRFGRESYWYVEHDGRIYYIAESTPLGNVANFHNPEYIGFFIGDNPWKSFEVEYIVDV